MGSVFKKIVTRPSPPNAEIVTRKGIGLARWRDARGKVKNARLTVNTEGVERIRDESATYSLLIVARSNGWCCLPR
jgi:hypothetical protein